MSESPFLTPRSQSRGKRCLPSIPNVKKGVNYRPNLGGKSVTFNTETEETSIGGTQSTGHIKPLSVSLSFNLDENSVSTNSSNISSSVEIPAGPGENSVDSNTSTNENNSDSILSVDENYSVKNQVVEADVEDKENFLTPVQGTNGSNFRTSLDRIDFDNFSSPSMRTPRRRYTLDEKLLNTPECYSSVQMPDLPRYEFAFDKDDHIDGEDSSSVTVAVRVRPYSQRELCDANVKCVVSMNGNETSIVSESGNKHRFTYDFSFWSFDNGHGEFASQEHVYLMLAQPLLGKAFEGYNTCLFAYGQTGSGKSYSIMGHGSEVGIVPRFCEELFSRAEVTRDSDKVKISVEISFFEIYNEKIHDLLASSKKSGGKKPTLRVREHPVLGPYVEGLSTFVVNSFEDIEGWITLGNKNRATAATGMNDKSSRSHSVFTLVLTQTKTEEIDGQEHDHSITSKINLVDLAGSERQSQAQTSGERLREGANINKSLMSLGKVISQLSDQSFSLGKKKKAFIPYRDSVLTWLLKESLGGNSKTAMIATISPAHHHTEETLSTLRYAKQARNIVNLARVNEDPKARIIRELKAEIDRLRGQTGTMNDDTHAANLEEIASLRDQLLLKEREMNDITRSWQERLRRAEERKIQEAKQLEKAGIAFKVDNKLPNLVNLNEDPQLSDLLLYVIKEGQTRVGRMCPDSKHEIQLNGALIADNHCIINNVESVVSITPIGDAPTYVNGDMVLEPTILHHGDRVILGGDHYFRFNHPMEVKNKTSQISQEMKDFEYAKQELLNAQESRLQAELEEAREEARRQAEEEKLQEIEKAKREAEMELKLQKSGYEGKLSELEQILKTQLQSTQEAEDKIQKLKKQKMMLEQEVIAGRKRQELEENAAKKAASLVSYERSPLLELLEAEKQRVASRLEELKQRRIETASPCKRQQNEDSQMGRTDLYKVALLLREANKISQILKRNTTFTREDYIEDEKVQTIIKVTNNKLGVCTHWTVPKFEDKLLQMRDLYQNEAEGSADDEVFNDPDDAWEQDQKTPSPFIKSPKSRQTPRQSFQSPNTRGSVMSSVSSMDESYRTGRMEDTLADKILQSCDRIKHVVSMAMDLYGNEDNTTNISEHNTETLHMNSISLVSSFHSLTSNCALWTSSLLAENMHSTFIQDLTQKLRDLTKCIGNHIVKFFQGCENSIDSLIQESCEKITDISLDICKSTGELALATDTNITTIDQLSDDMPAINLSADICMSFLNGCDLFIDKSLQGAIKSVEEWECKAQTFTDKTADRLNLGELPQKVEIVVCCAKDLLSKCQELQVEVDNSMRESLDSLPSQYYSINYKRSQGLIAQVSDLLEKTGLLMQQVQPVMEGKDGDLRKVSRCAELIQNGAVQLLHSSNIDKTDKSRSSEGNDLSDLSVLSNSQMERLEYAAQELKSGAQSLIDQVEKVIGYERQVSTPRGKRLLPAAPDRAAPSPITQIKGMPLKRNISLLGKSSGS